MHRNHRRLILGFTLMLTLGLTPSAESNVIQPVRRLTDSSTGLVTVRLGNYEYRASGVVARHSRVIYTAAHLLFDNGRWATAYNFFPGYHAGRMPHSDGLRPRGYRILTSYARQSRRFGLTSPRIFAEDFGVFFGHRRFGPPVGYWTNGGAALRSPARSKRLLGYPAALDYTGRGGGAYQHSTEYFKLPARRIYGAFHAFDRVSTGAGASGGPVYVMANGEDRLAGILVAGSRTTTGVYALDPRAHALAAAAIGDARARSGSFRNRQALTLRSGAANFAARSVAVTLPGTIRRLSLDTRIATHYRGGLEVYLRAPSGRVRWVSRRAGGAAHNLFVQKADYTANFRGLRSQGRWRLYMRDVRPGSRARYQSFVLHVTARD